MSQRALHRPLAAVAALAAVLLIAPLAAGAAGAAPAKKVPACAGKTKKAAIQAIETSYDMVLNGTVPDRTLDERFGFIEGSEDPAFRAVLDDIAAKNAAMLVTTTVQINDVTCSGKKTADVLYDLVLSGTPSPGLAGPGTAVLDGKVWKMTSVTVCNLFSLADPLLLESGPCADIALGGT